MSPVHARGFHSLLLDSLYAAALGDVPWEEPLALIRERLNVRAAALLSLDMTSGLPFAHVIASDDPSWTKRFQADYQAEYRLDDPTPGVVAHWNPGRWFDDGRDIDAMKRSRGRYHQECMPLHGIGGFSGFFIQKEAQRSDYLSVISAVGQASPSAPQIHMLEVVRSHLARALNVQARFASLEAKGALANAALDALEFPVFVLDESRVMLLVNTAGRKWMAEQPALRVVAGRFAPEGFTEPEQWRNACAQGALLLRGQAGESLPLTLSPVPPDTRLAHNWQRPLTLMLGPSMALPDLRERRLRALYGLTPAEAELCVLLAYDGLSQQACAVARRVSLNTVRSQVKSIEAKLGVNSLAQVTRMALMLEGNPPDKPTGPV